MTIFWAKATWVVPVVSYSRLRAAKGALRGIDFPSPRFAGVCLCTGIIPPPPLPSVLPHMSHAGLLLNAANASYVSVLSAHSSHCPATQLLIKSPRGPYIGPSELLKGTICSSYAVCDLSVQGAVRAENTAQVLKVGHHF